MSAFKAANPDAVFEDFIRWHSPGDWENDDAQENGSTNKLAMVNPNNFWPPQGQLSQRMSEHGNLWRNIWNDAPALPASEQKPLLDPNREGEKASFFGEIYILLVYPKKCSLLWYFGRRILYCQIPCCMLFILRSSCLTRPRTR